jgi:hypothetical protein
MIVKIVRQASILVQECNRAEFNNPPHSDDGEEPEPHLECLLSLYAIREGYPYPAHLCTESIFKGTVVYLENHDGKTIEQFHW